MTHKPDKCRNKEKKTAAAKTKPGPKDTKWVVVDTDKLWAAVGVLAESAGQDAESLHASLMAAIAPDSDDSSQE